MKTFSEWCINKHRQTNHFYDTYLPYEFHLRMVVKVFEDFKHLLPKELYYEDKTNWHPGDGPSHAGWLHVIESACWGHDLIEDTRTSYNDIKSQFPNNGDLIAEVIYAVTNNKGRNRKERADITFYAEMRKVKGATFVKLCDRIANVQYSKMSGSRMFEMYKEENQTFVVNMDNQWPEMIQYLKDLFK